MAILSSRKFPKFLVEDEKFIENDFEAALKSTYMRMDAYIKSPDGQQELQDILEQSAQAKQKKDEEEEEEDLEDEDLENGGEHDSGETPLAQWLIKSVEWSVSLHMDGA